MKLSFSYQVLVAVAVLGVGMFGGCDSDDDPGVPSDFEISLNRSGCFGTCPAYSVTVEADGAVNYNGRAFVIVEGGQEGTISEDEVKYLFDLVNIAGFFALEERYTMSVTDLPTIDTSVKMYRMSKSVSHYGTGCGTEYDSAPAGLCRIEEYLEALVMEFEWVGEH